jgi:hypothetical protein
MMKSALTLITLAAANGEGMGYWTGLQDYYEVRACY